MMHRAICRVLRGSCRKWRESEVPAVSGEDVKNNKWKNQEFVPPKHTWNEALGWTTGLVLAWQLTHRKCTLGEESPSYPGFSSSGFTRCPFGVTAVVNQPIVSTVNNVVERKSLRGRNQRTSIDSTPFLKEDLSLFDSSNIDYTQTFTNDDCDIVFEEEKPLKLSILKSPVLLKTKTLEEKEEGKPSVDRIVNKLSADLYSALGAFIFLHKGPKENSQTVKVSLEAPQTESKSPPIHAMDLLNKGAELGSSRALYNIGVAYDRMNEQNLAQEYYRKAADLGHPLATYNASIFSLRDGNYTEGLTLLRQAAEKGVPEAKKVLKDINI